MKITKCEPYVQAFVSGQRVMVQLVHLCNINNSEHLMRFHFCSAYAKFQKLEQASQGQQTSGHGICIAHPLLVSRLQQLPEIFF